MKKIPVYMMTVLVMAGMLFGGRNGVMASELKKNDESVNRVTPKAAVNYSATVKDSSKNKYKVSGHCERVGKQAAVVTSFKISYYYDGKDTADKYTKKMTSSGKVGLSGGGENKFSHSESKTGYSGTTKASDSYKYNVTIVSGTHSFSCNGGSGKGSSNNY